MGGDSRGKEHDVPRSDTILVASIDPVTKRAHLMSILRDTYVDIPGRGRDRINAAVSYGGPRLAMRTVSQLLGIPIQYYVYTDFEGFVAAVDAVGGIDIEVEKDMKYYDRSDGPEYAIDLKKGWQHLDGRKALQYVRFRHDALSDYARTERQRKFLIALARKMQSTTSLLKLPSIIDKVEPYVETNMTVSDMIKLGALALEAKDRWLMEHRDRRLRPVGMRPRSLLTKVGEVTFTRRYYVDRATGEGHFLLDEALGLWPRQRYSPAVRELAIRLAVETSFGTAEQWLERWTQGQVRISRMAIWEGVQEAGSAAAEEAERVREALFERGEVPEGARVARELNVEFDELFVRGRQRAGGRKEWIGPKHGPAYEGKKTDAWGRAVLN